MRKYVLAAAVAVCAVAGTAQAQITPVYTQGNFAVTNSSASVFERFNATTPTTANGSAPYDPSTNKNLPVGITESVTGNVLLGKAGTSVQNIATDPGTGDNYIAIEPGGTFTVSFSTAIRYFSFVVGTLDSYNQVTINFVGAPSQTLTGTAITGAANSLGTNGRVTFNAGYGPAFSSIVFSETNGASPAFEITDLAAAAPEPATWGLMIMGFGLAGSALRVRRRKVAAPFA